ncbi:MAG: serpin family protein, partial [Planctomycetota bacterium]|nr:serpin family protein [Planctomycetota bacterium]
MTSLTRLLVLSGVVSLSNALGSIEASGGEWAVTDDQAPPIEFAAKSQTEMGFDLYRELAAQKPGENISLSPISIAQAFALLAEGA